MKFSVFFLGLFIVYNASCENKKSARFVSETVAQGSDIIQYKKIGTSSYFGLFGRNSKIQCAEVCLNEDSCESFYMEGGACVFGVSGDNTAFAEDETANPNSEQRIQVKGMCLLNCLIENKHVQTY